MKLIKKTNTFQIFSVKKPSILISICLVDVTCVLHTLPLLAHIEEYVTTSLSFRLHFRLRYLGHVRIVKAEPTPLLDIVDVADVMAGRGGNTHVAHNTDQFVAVSKVSFLCEEKQNIL